MILIADGGSTKAHWSVINSELIIDDFYSEGYNPFYVGPDYIVPSLTKALPSVLNPDAVTELYFYGAGVHGEDKAAILKDAFSRIFTNASICIEHDLLASCRALLGDSPGFAGILGTGTNSAVYDGTRVSFSIESASYILGDEGSGCYIGKKLLKDILRKSLPSDLLDKFYAKYKTNDHEIMDQVYTQPLANRYCASFTAFVGENIEYPYCQELVKSSFRDFFRELVCLYPNYQQHTFNCIGSIAYHFEKLLREIAEEFSMEVGNITKGPMVGLREFHIKLAGSSVV